jgi:uncharacterized membrane protein YqaE (UPF0057 family)
MLDKLKDYVSRKFIITVLTILLVTLNKKFALGIDDNAINNIVLTVVGYILGQSAVDVTKVIKK